MIVVSGNEHVSVLQRRIGTSQNTGYVPHLDRLLDGRREMNGGEGAARSALQQLVEFLGSSAPHEDFWKRYRRWRLLRIDQPGIWLSGAGLLALDQNQCSRPGS